MSADDMKSQIDAVMREEADSGAACAWRSCTGCLESEDGHSVGHYPYSDVFGCLVGGGCHECGGLGVVWEYYPKSALDQMAREFQETPSEAVSRLIQEAISIAPKAGLFLKIRVEAAP